MATLKSKEWLENLGDSANVEVPNLCAQILTKNIREEEEIVRGQEQAIIAEIEKSVLQDSDDGQEQVTEPVEYDKTIERVEGKYYVRYLPKEALGPRFGSAVGNIAMVRRDLSPRVKRFVEAHELYHCRDFKTWGGG